MSSHLTGFPIIKISVGAKLFSFQNDQSTAIEKNRSDKCLYTKKLRAVFKIPASTVTECTEKNVTR